MLAIAYLALQACISVLRSFRKVLRYFCLPLSHWKYPCSYCKRGKSCWTNSPGGHLCNFIARSAENWFPPEPDCVVLLGHVQDTENYIFQKLIRTRDRSANKYVIFLKVTIVTKLTRLEFSPVMFRSKLPNLLWNFHPVVHCRFYSQNFGPSVIGLVNGEVFSVMGLKKCQINLLGRFSGNDPIKNWRT